MMILFNLSATLLFVACLLLLWLRGRGHTADRVPFDTSAYDEDPVRITGLLLRPRDRGPRRLPGLVFCHGIIANKEIYLGLCRRIANLGVAVLAIDLRGHGHSGGPSSFGKSESHDVWAAVDVLAERDDIDPERIGVIGHSLGGVAVTRAAFEQPLDRIKAAVAIFCWQGFGDAVEAVFGPMERFVARWWPLFGWSRRFSVTDPDALRERSLMDRLDPETRVNYLLVVGSGDPLTDMKRSREIVARASGQTGIEPGITYGNCTERSARRLEIIKGANHYSVLSRRTTFEAIRQWLHQGLGLEETAEVPRTSRAGLLRIVGRVSVLLQAVSTLALAGCLMGSLLPEQALGHVAVPPLCLTGMATAAFLLCSALAIPLARAIPLTPFTPAWGADIVSLVATSRTILFAPILALLAWRGPGGGRPAFEALGLAPAVACTGVAAAGVLFIWGLCSWNLVARSNRFTTLWPVVTLGVYLRLFSLLLIAYLAEEALFRGMIQGQLSLFGPVLEVLVSAIVYSVIASVGMTAALRPLFPSVSYAATFRSRSIVLLPVVFGFALAVFLVHGLVAALLYHFTGTVVAPALFLALLVSFVFTGPIGTRTC